MKTHRKLPAKRSGFAIIATMVLMVLIALIAIGLMSLVASRNRIAAQKLLVEEARQQAKVGLDAAIAALQAEVGPDQRVTANSGILNSSDGGSNPYLLGVWNSWDGPIYGDSVSGKASKIQETYEKGRPSMFRRWLISSRDEKATQQLGAYKQLSSRQPGKRICLIGEGTLGNSASRDQYIYADLISMPSRGNNTTQYAWWVGGENQKAKINIEELEETNDPIEALHRTWDTPPPSFVGSQLYEELSQPIENNAKLLTLQTLPLTSNSSRSAGSPYFFDITTSSYTLPINVSMGGLKQDLSLLLNKKNLEGTEFARRTKQDAPIVEKGSLVPEGKMRDMPIGSMQNLHAYHNTWPNGEGSPNAFSARLVGNLNNAYTRMSGSGYEDKKYVRDTNAAKESDFDTKTMLEEGSRTAGYARVPVLLSYMKSFFMYCEPSGQDVYRLSVGYTPIVLWWNPYNVPMRVAGKKLWVHTIPYKTMWLQSWSQHSDGKPVRWTNYCMIQPYVPDPNNLSSGAGGTAYDIAQSFGEDYGQYFVKTKGDENADIVFAPGEILIFSPSNGTSAGSDGAGGITGAFQNPFYNEYDPKTTSGLKAYFYSGAPSWALSTENRSLNLRLGGHKDPVYGNDIPISNRNLGYFFAGSREMLTIRSGFLGLHKADRSSDAIGKYLNSPHRFTLGWYDPDATSGEETKLEIMNKTFWNPTMNDVDQPYYIAAVGIVPKSANGILKTRFSTGDYRTKSWQYSGAAFFGSRIAEPDEQMRTYHPYQLVNIEIGGGLTTSPLENIGKNGFYGVSSDGEQVSFISSMEIPMHPPFSLAGYSGMRLSPGWFENTQRTIFDGGSSNLIRQQYQSGVPAVGIGNAFADPTLPADGIHSVYNHNYPLIYGQEVIFDDYYDHGLLINDALWDRFFTSSISDMPTKSGTQEARTTLTEFLSDQSPLPVSRIVKADNPYSDEAIIQRVMAEDGWKYIAQFVMIDGGFNINSTSVEAWAATLRGLAKRKLVTNVDGKLGFVEPDKGDTDVLFSRFMVSTTDKSVDSLGGYSMMRGSETLRGGGGLASAWGEVRKLSNDAIQELAERIVEQVRERGPFLSMSDFINRRLDAGNKEHALTGALQAAIDRTSINDNFKEVMITDANEGKFFKFSEAALGSIHTAAPGYLIQSDILMSLSNILTLRDDTFIVRSYGCVRNSNDAILAQAWCEAIVQRTIDYVDPSNNPYESERNPDGTQASGDFSEMNKIMGRKLKVVSFRWLDHWDI